MNRQDYIAADPAILVGKPVIKNTRLAVESGNCSVVEERTIPMRPLLESPK
jgi:hypothetical protein